MGKIKETTLFGGDKGWNSSDWTASDDRVRGGKSQSYLETSSSSSSARFHGNLDIKTLGGAGFASQRTTGDDKSWDLSDYDGIRIDLGKSDNKRYTFILKDAILPRNPDNGREQSTTSYEYDFDVSEDAALAKTSFVYMSWERFVPTYRGKEKKDAPSLDTKNIKRLSIMMRSFFGDQEGDFSLNIKSIKAVSPPIDLERGLVDAKNEHAEKLRDIKLQTHAANAVARSAIELGSRGYVPSVGRMRALSVYGLCLAAACLLAYSWAKDVRPKWPWH
ncbi:CIA30-domain-containing protein [Pleomassaria siparia CBS 279.74]|uniref:CIA30-domain-containing protein n=1 Tax=Pleomassaria siparia CBS 279.74 TaxID=1314801 RepID=A0A6G1K2G4_9PLEO|nr:CIA30-domain-containing protein [Pleomassaria siparia CBS 279.74]